MLFMMLFVVCATSAKAFHIHLHGMVTEYFSGAPMKGVQVRLVKDSIERETVVTGTNGRYELYLERGYDYQVWFHRNDLVTKYVRIDARDIPLIPDVPFFDMDLQMTMFRWLEGFDHSAFDQPVGLATYKHSVRNLNWNVDFTNARRAEIDRVMINYERALDKYERATRSNGRKGASSTVRRKKKVTYF